MARIRELPPEVYRKIAAGEVVERPLSVVKELVENALDAGADHIHVELEDGGRRRVRVSDNGCGFEAEDIPLAFQRHFTSKLAEISDLDRLTTLGFRGEALASLHEVARIQLLSATAEGTGIRMDLEPGGKPRLQDVSASRGTRITVSDLFFNFPVRRKFLKSARTETSRVVSWMETIALAWWQVGFELDHNGRTLFHYPRVDSLLERVYQVLGRETAAELVGVDNRTGSGSCAGLVSRSRGGGPDRRRQFFFVNRRPVREQTLMAALHNAAAPFLEKGRHPVAVLLLDVAAEDIDVNIHPMKLEIRFRDQQAAFRLVYHAVAAAMGNPAAPGEAFPPAETTGRTAPSAAAAAGAADRSRSDPEWENGVMRVLENPPLFAATELGGRNLRVLGQYRNAYIVAEKAGELILIDQHNAHERVIYDRLRRQVGERRVESASPLFPMLIDLSATERELLEEKADILAELGFELEPLGGVSVAVRRYPRLLAEADVADALREALEPDEKEVESGGDLSLAGVACKAAIKVNQALSLEEMQRLADDLYACENPEFCPHRRPIVVHITLEEIEKRVRRR
ncbi:MAG: DNA mismatch repair endonuclease MutL [Acidobacteriota bacterium]|jgi:DNA mismatch repair protein MutL|nr:DNA mismatch repair endonuclease MutL [Acidobacteriota bacterium]